MQHKKIILDYLLTVVKYLEIVFGEHFNSFFYQLLWDVQAEVQKHFVNYFNI